MPTWAEKKGKTGRSYIYMYMIHYIYCGLLCTVPSLAECAKLCSSGLAVCHLTSMSSLQACAEHEPRIVGALCGSGRVPWCSHGLFRLVVFFALCRFLFFCVCVCVCVLSLWVQTESLSPHSVTTSGSGQHAYSFSICKLSKA